MKLLALRVNQNGTIFYKTAVKAGNLTDESLWRPDRWREESNEGYQREVNNNHARRISRYLELKESETNLLPTDIVVNFREPLEIKELSQGFVELNLTKWPGYIMDGQHRLSGARQAIEDGYDLEDYEFGVTITNLSLEDEMVQFRNINQRSNKASKGLTELIGHQLQYRFGHAPQTAQELTTNRLTSFVVRFGTELDSPFRGLIAMGGHYRRAGIHTINQGQMSQSLRTQFYQGRFSDPSENPDVIYDLVTDFWKAASEVWPAAMSDRDSFIIQKPHGVMAMHRIMGKIFNNIGIHPTHEDFFKVLTGARDGFDFDDAAWANDGVLVQSLRGYTLGRSYQVLSDQLWASYISSKE